jgi:hypothetical protein
LLLLFCPAAPAPPDITPATLHHHDATRSSNCRELRHTNAEAPSRFDGAGKKARQWSVSNIRIPFQQVLLRMLETKDHWKILIAVELWI